MFWQTTEETSLDLLLKSEEISLNAVLDNPYTLQEIRNGNETLVTYLIKDEILVEMMTNALHPVIDETVPVKDQYKFSNMCTEVFSTFSGVITTAVFCNTKCMELIVTCLDAPMNSVVASFFCKIVGNLFSRDAKQTVEHLLPTSFVSKCMEHLEHGAIGELLFKFACSPVDPDLVQTINKWMEEGGLVEGLVSAFSPLKHPQAHYVASYVHSEIITYFREVLYQSEEKVVNCLLASLSSELTVSRVMDAMLQRDENGHLNESIVTEGAGLLEKLLETNTVWQRPSCALDGDRMDAWMGGIPDAFTQVQGWQPDPDRIVEKVIASRSEEILKGVLADLQLPAAVRGTSWKYLMDLIVEIMDTNWSESHVALKKSFKNVPFAKFLDACLAHPELNILHRQVQKMVEFTLGSSCTPESPLIIYMFNDADIIVYIRSHLTECIANPLASNMAQISKRSFLFNLGCAFNRARMGGCNKERLESILGSCAKWKELSSDLEVFTDRNKMADTDRAPSFTSSRTYNVEVDITPQQASNQMAQATLHEMESTHPSQELPGHFDPPLSALVRPFDKMSYSIESHPSMDITAPFTVSTAAADESALDDRCNLRNEMGDGEEEEEEEEGGEGDEMMNSRGYESSEKSNTSARSVEWPGTETASSSSGEGRGKEEEWPGEEKKTPVDGGVEWDVNKITGSQMHE
ncbi:hypothetical protein PFISCL1PPCAC_8128 [Pristionchus fissidentatus]|uniref:Uncharacterized protein n=1 Tax=Pristionchus fissidentatus TaxID=1538716 RepID=A0AAV5VAZ3_9BILA|nr:hypothetical protein PFISCL1PPCAC_8128 [Pristionchus fissidentatus]